MSISFRASAMRLAVAATAVVLGAGGVAAGWAMSQPATGAAATPPPVDHQLCYSASSTAFKIPPGVKLLDQFSPSGFLPRISSTLTVHCNPVQKTLPSGGTFPITNPNAHLACFPITPRSTQPTPVVNVANQFGTAVLVPGQPNLLCAPSWKSLTGPPGRTPPTPPGLNHFTCYPVRVASGRYTPPPVMLKDEFAHAGVTAQVSPVPVELCLPTEKIVGTHVFRIINPAMHLLFFPVTRTPIVPKVWDENQFGTSVVTIRATNWLGVPSTKRIG
jgi:hypothetical protein